jgi:hypothetical protein
VLADVTLGANRAGDVGADPRLPLEVSGGWFGGEAHAADGVACGC